MAMTKDELTFLLKTAFPNSIIDITDLAGDNNHFSASITSSSFEGLSRVHQHQLVYKALQGKVGTLLHALSIQTHTPSQTSSKKD